MDRFVVGTGRCGSTLLSKMLAQHPDALSLSEFFTGLDMARCFAPQLSGEELARLVSAEQPFVTAVLRRGHKVEEVTYPFGDPTVRYATTDAVPWLLVATLPPLTAAPDALYDEILGWLHTQPPRTAAEQYRTLFAWMAKRVDKTLWIERSGSSIGFLDALVSHFPDARFVHIHRDAAEAALSMREHPAYRLNVALRYDVPLDDGRRPSEIGAHDLQGTPFENDAISNILRSRPAPETFGRFWSDLMWRGLDAMERISADSLHSVRFEDLLAQPHDVLAGVAEFLELGQGEWVNRAAALVRDAPPKRVSALNADEAATLQEACRPAAERLRKEGR